MSNTVQALFAQDGTSLGVYQATNDIGIGGQPIVTDDSLFVSSPSSTYVFNLASHQLLQKIPYGGPLSVANGFLYIAAQDGSVHAYRATSVPPAGYMLAPAMVGGSCQIQFVGMPGQTYSLQRAYSVTGPWTTLTTITLDASGIGTWSETPSLTESAFYRTSSP
jgi:hypothetical protein